MTDDRRHHPEQPSEEEGKRVPIRVRDRRAMSEEAEAPEEHTQDDASEPDECDRRLEEAEQLAAERLDQLMRMKADFENYRKRVIREQTDIVERASLRVVERLLEVLDDFDRALEAARNHEGAEGIVRGMELVYNRLVDILQSEGLERVEAEGLTFDPTEHEAIGSEAGDVAEPTVLEVVRPGYRMKGKTIRPALVHVTTPAEDTDTTDAPEEGREE